MNLLSRALNLDINADARWQACSIKPFSSPPILKPRGDEGPKRADAIFLPVRPPLGPPPPSTAQHVYPKKREVQMLTQALFWIQDLSVRIRARFSVLLKSERRARAGIVLCSDENTDKQFAGKLFTIFHWCWNKKSKMTAPISQQRIAVVPRNAALFPPTAFVRSCWDDPIIAIDDHRSNLVFWWQKSTMLDGWRNKPVLSAAECWMLGIGVQMKGFFPF